MKRLECRVIFEKSGYGVPKKYSYLTDLENLQEGDPVIVHANNDYSIAYFYDYEATGRGAKWIVGKVDTAKHELLMEQERKYQIKKKEMDAIKQQMIQRKAMLEEEAIYRLLAETDPVMAELLNKMTEIEKREV